VVLVAAEADRALADRLDQIEHGLALLGAHGVAEHAAEQADVVAEGRSLSSLCCVRSSEILSCRLSVRKAQRAPC
jgi:hypothetical protein